MIVRAPGADARWPEPAAIEPVVNQRVTGAGRHRAERRRRGWPSPPMAALSGSDSNHSSVNSTADIDRLRMTRNMSLPPSRRSFSASDASGRPSDAPGDFRQARHRRCVRGVEERCRRVHERDELRPARGVARRQSLDRVERRRVVGVGRQPQRAAVGQHRPVQAGSVVLRVESVTRRDRGRARYPAASARPACNGATSKPGPYDERRELSAGDSRRLEHEYFLAGLGEVRAVTSPL